MNVINFDQGTMPTREDSQKAQLFLRENAFRLMEMRVAILADKRLAMTPVEVGNNLAYTGTGGLRGATLGVWLTWWNECESSHAEIESVGRLPIIYFAGSPLSGSNSCNCVDSSGRCYKVSVGYFSPVWRSFMDINKRFAEELYGGPVATLDEIAEMLL